MEQVTFQDIADALGVKKRAVQQRAKRNNWHYTEETVTGGKRRLFDLEGLPNAVKKAFDSWKPKKEKDAILVIAKSDDEDITPPTKNLTFDEFLEPDRLAEKKHEDERQKIRQEGMKKYAALPTAKKKQANAKLWIIHECEKYIEKNGYQRTAGIDYFCADLKGGEITIPDRFKAHLSPLHGQVNLDPSTLRQWEKNLKDKGLIGLANNYGSQKGKTKISKNPELQSVILGCMDRKPHIKSDQVKQYIEAGHPELDIVSTKSIDRFMKEWKKEHFDLWTYRTNPDKWKNNYQPAFGSHHDQITRLNELWELDSTPGDWLLTDGRHSVIGVIDMYCRRMKLFVSKTSKATAVCQVFRKAVLAWGIPEGARTDNGKDYVSEQFTGVLGDLNIPQYLCLPFASEEKGTIERALQTMSHGILDLLPGFIGHNVAERKVIEARKSFAQRIMKSDEVVEVSLSSSELQKILDDWTDHMYGKNPHSGLDGKTPWEVARNYTGPIKWITDERALDMLLAEGGIRTITNKGLAVGRNKYFAPVMGAMVGREIRYKHDESDIGRIIVYDLNKGFICEAVCHKLLGISPVESANAAKAHGKKVMAENSKILKESRKYVKENIPEVVLKHRIEQSQNVTALPLKKEEYTTPALEGAAQAADFKFNRNPESPELSEQEQLAQTELEAMMRQPAEVIDLRDSPEQRYARAYTLERREALSEEDQQWLSVYQSGSEYAAMKDFHTEFGLTPEWSGTR